VNLAGLLTAAGTMDPGPTVAAGVSCSRTSSSSRSFTADDVDDPVDEMTRRQARHQALSEVDVIEDIIEGFSIASFNSLEDMQVSLFTKS